VIYKGKGEVEHGVVMMRTEGDARALARVPANDAATLKHLLEPGPARQWIARRDRVRLKTACWSGRWVASRGRRA
jgi:hypothetical protein